MSLKRIVVEDIKISKKNLVNDIVVPINPDYLVSDLKMVNSILFHLEI